MKISIIGLGAMGSALARTLIDTGNDVTVWNRTTARAAPLVEMGAVQASSARDAVEASDIVLVCIMSHTDTRALLGDFGASLAGRTIVELSTGDTDNARSLFEWVSDQGAHCLIGMIAVFPGDIGKPESSIVTVGDEGAWDAASDVLKTLGGRSRHLGPNIAALPALFAGLFLPRQAFMFGMIYGALICEKAGISMEDYAAQIPLTLKVTHDYYDIFARTVPTQDFSDPPASIKAYAAAFRDVVETFEAHGVRRELPVLLAELMQQGAVSGLGDQHATALTRLLRG
jgi:3-hydroxyisobutyrate dehydrogenase-like beta-hydroxyacid dehydrogenase